MTAEMNVSGNGAEGREKLSSTICVEAVLPLGCSSEELAIIAKNGEMEVLTLPRFSGGEKITSTTVLCPEIATETRYLRENSVANGIKCLWAAGITPRPNQQEDTYLLVGRRPVCLTGSGVYYARDAMKPPGRGRVLDGWSFSYFCPQDSLKPARVGVGVESDIFSNGRPPPFFSGPEWDGFISEVDRVLEQTVVNLLWTEVVRGNDYY